MKWSPIAPRRVPLLQVAKSAIATLGAWLLAGWLIPGPVPVFAAIAALLTVQPSISQSFGRGVERTVGVIAGVVVASAIGIVLGTGFWAIGLAVVCALLLAWTLRATPGTANQVAISAMLVLALGTATPHYALDRILETAMGAAIGLIVNVAVVPPLALGPARAQVASLVEGTAAALDRLGTALVTLQSPEELTDLLARARDLRQEVTRAEATLGEASDSLALNPRGRGRTTEVDALGADVRRLFAIVTQLIGMTRAFVDDYDDTIAGDRQVAAIAEQLHRAAHDVRIAPPTAVTGEDGTADSGESASAGEPPALTRPLELPTATPEHWVLVGSLLVDLRRIHGGIAATS